MLIMGATAFFLRRARYEIFYIIHVAMFIIIVITAALHRPKFGSKSVIIFIFTGCLWFSDRLIRGLRILFNAYGNNATLTALPHGGVRVTMRRSLWFAKPAEHLVLWVPRVRKLETHPFTIVSTNPLELVVKAHDGFTRDLRAYALANPGAALRASVDGPYGAIPSFVKYDRLVLIAGGSGSSFTFGAALSVVRSAAAKKPFINFVWVVRDCGMSSSTSPSFSPPSPCLAPKTTLVKPFSNPCFNRQPQVVHLRTLRAPLRPQCPTHPAHLSIHLVQNFFLVLHRRERLRHRVPCHPHPHIDNHQREVPSDDPRRRKDISALLKRERDASVLDGCYCWPC
jgi:hypothetical protein